MAENSERVLLDAWLDGTLRSYAYIVGAKGLKNFTKGAGEVFLASLENKAEAVGKRLDVSGGPTKAMEALAKLEMDMGIYKEGHMSITGSAESCEVDFKGCPYATVCSGILGELVEAALPANALPCLRADICSAAVTKAGKKAQYILKKFAPGDHCIVTMDIL